MLNELKMLTLPPNAKLFTCDTNSMYNNIDTNHVIKVITWWLQDLHSKDELPLKFPLEAVIHATKMITKNTIF